MKLIAKPSKNITHWHGCQEVVEVPVCVSVCPECRGKLLVQVNGCEAKTGALTEEDMIEVECENEPDPDDPEYNDKRHRWYQGEWMSTLARVRWWARRVMTVDMSDKDVERC